MKKTLIALAVAASAAVSGSAMAWTVNGTGGSVDLGGTLTPTDVITPWEVKVGNAVTGLDALVQKGQKTVEVKTSSAIPVLGIRTQDSTFMGQSGISPQISYDGAVDVDSFSAGTTTLTLNVTDANGDEIGTMSVPFLAAALSSYTNGSTSNTKSLYASERGKGFFGGLGKDSSAVAQYPVSATSGIFAEASENFSYQGITSLSDPGETGFSVTSGTYSAFYASGIESGKTITITLDQAVSGDDAIQWKASLPITVSYQ
ncbi:TPA: hypothetical protein M2Q89_004931 [Escherichia coli]|nr:hypothetical protein [Escherichia coli]